MTQRERVLTICLGGAVAAYLAFTVVKKLVYEPRQELQQAIRQQLERRDRLEVRVAGADKTIAAWHKLTARSLYAELLDDAHLAFRADVDQLLNRNNLREKVQVSQPNPSTEKRGPREGFVELPLSIRVEGTLGDLVNFLRDLYQRPYFVRVDKLTLRAENAGARSKKERGGSEPKLSIAMTVSTLVLPKLKDIAHPSFDLAALSNPEGEAQLVSAGRLRADDYSDITRKNIFKLYEPPRIAEAPKPREEPPREAPKAPPPPPPPPRRPDLVLQGVGQLPEGPVAYVVTAGKAIDPPHAYRLNDEVDGGRIVLIVPEGVVLRVAPRDQPGAEARNYFWPLGSSSEQRVEVSPAEHPDVVRLLRLVLGP